MNKFAVRLDYQGGCDDDDGNFISDSPDIIITKNGYDWLVIYERPVAKVKYPDCNNEHWDIPENVKRLMDVLNKSENIFKD